MSELEIPDLQQTRQRCLAEQQMAIDMMKEAVEVIRSHRPTFRLAVDSVEQADEIIEQSSMHIGTIHYFSSERPEHVIANEIIASMVNTTSKSSICRSACLKLREELCKIAFQQVLI